MTDLSSLPPELKSRYGVGRRPWGTIALSAAVIVAFFAAVIFVGVMMARPSVDSNLLTYTVVSAERIDVTFDVRTGNPGDVTCVLRAQDESRADVGYAIVPLSVTDGYEQVTYSLRTIAPGYIIEVLGCAVGTEPAVPGPQFPAGVIPPEQPWTP